MTAALLSIDPNYASGTGMALWLRDERGDWQVADTYTVTLGKGRGENRPVNMMNGIAERAQQWQRIHHCRVRYVALEATYQGPNAEVSRNLNELLGMIRYHFTDFTEWVRDYTAAEIDKRCDLRYHTGGRKRATATVARMITGGAIDLTEHEADAVCVGFAALADIDRRVEV